MVRLPQGKDVDAIGPTAVLAVGIIAVSTASILIRYAQTGAPSLVIATYRLGIASLVLAPLAYRGHRGELRGLRLADWWLAILSGVFLAIHFAAWITSLEYASVASSVVLVSTSPLWVAVGAWLLLGERLTRRAVSGLILALGGVIVIALSDSMQKVGSSPLLGNGLALFGAVMVACYWLIGRRLRQSLSLVPYVAPVYSTAAIVLLMMTIRAGQPLLVISQSFTYGSCCWD